MELGQHKWRMNYNISWKTTSPVEGDVLNRPHARNNSSSEPLIKLVVKDFSLYEAVDDKME